MDNHEVLPFRIAIPDADVEDLRRRLHNTRYPVGLPGDAWSKGVPLDYARYLVDYWRDEFDWRAAEAKLNEFPQFTTQIDGARIHFLHVRSTHENAIPILLTHGWPGSIVEFMKIIGPLTQPELHGGETDVAFHVIAPSLPGYAFSELIEGGVPAVANAWAHLMDRLGYASYVTQGGDTGAAVSPLVARVDPNHVIGVHTNGLETFYFGDESQLKGLSPEERERVTRDRSDGAAYAMIQGTRGQTLSYALADSPVGQLTWIAEKFHEWTDPAKPLPHEAVDIDQLLTNVSLYWFTDCAATAMENYWYGIHSGTWGRPLETSAIPFAGTRFPGDSSVRAFAEREHNVVQWHEFDRGGHFAAMEAPDLLVDDIREFARRLAKANTRPV